MAGHNGGLGKFAGRTLVLLRHAKAVGDSDGSDKDRVLAPRGRRQAEALGPLLSEALGRVDVALVSESARTRETIELAGVTLPITKELVTPDLYDAGREDVLRLVRGVSPSTRVVLVVGHEPTVSQLARYLHDEPTDTLGADVRLGISTATACVLKVPVEWQQVAEHNCHLTALLRPHV